MPVVSENFDNAIRALSESTISAASFIVLTAAQRDLLRADAARRDIVPTPKPWGGRLNTVANFLGIPYLVREVGADISDIPNPLDLRSIG